MNVCVQISKTLAVIPNTQGRIYHPGIDIRSCIFVLFKWKWWYATLWLPKILPSSSPVEHWWRTWGTRSLHSLTWLPLPGQRQRGTDVKASRSWGWSFSSSLDHSPAQNWRRLTRGWAEQGCSSRTSRSATPQLDLTRSLWSFRLPTFRSQNDQQGMRASNMREICEFEASLGYSETLFQTSKQNNSN